MLVQAHLYIKGDVIGVGFRAWTKIQAKFIGVAGWVRNSHDKSERFGLNGGVEAKIQGEENMVRQMIVTIEKGPPVAHVEGVDVVFEEPKEIFSGFEIKK